MPDERPLSEAQALAADTLRESVRLSEMETAERLQQQPPRPGQHEDNDSRRRPRRDLSQPQGQRDHRTKNEKDGRTQALSVNA